jgi:hypothetical protein
MNWFKNTLLISFLFLSVDAHTKVFVWTEGMVKVNGTSTENIESSTSSFGYRYQLHLAYRTAGNVHFAALLSGDSTSTSSTSGGTTSDSTVSKSFLGPSLGYFFQNGFYTIGTYFLSASQSSGSATSVTAEGSGYQGQFGFVSKFSGFKLTVSLAYRSYGWDTSGGADITNKVTTNETLPYIGLLFKF